MNRRQLFCSAGIALLARTAARAGLIPGSLIASPREIEDNPPKPLRLEDYEPTSMLQVPETYVERARYPVIDIHTHISLSTKWTNGVPLTPARRYLATPEELLSV